ncbi:SUKH-4 family immunity protein [Kribbella sp. NPDC055110]
MIEVLGDENLATLDPGEVELLGLSAPDAETLVEVGLPVEAGPLFTIDVVGEPGMLAVQRMTSADGEENLALFIGGPRDLPELRYFLDVRNGVVVLCSVVDEHPQYEVVNSSLSVFAEFLLRFAVYSAKGSATVEEDRLSIEELALLLHERDPYAIRNSGTWWSKVLDRLRGTALEEN